MATGGGAMVTLSLPQPEPARSRGLLPFEVQQSGDRLAFLADGNERFVLDAAWFAPWPSSTRVPRIVARWDNAGVEAALEGAMFPGTALCADLRLNVFRRAEVWLLRVELPCLGLNLEAPVEPWLQGTIGANGRLPAALEVFAPPHPPSLRLSGGARVELWQSGQLLFRRGSIRFDSAPGISHRTRNALLNLGPPSEESFVHLPGVMRTVITLERNREPWGWLSPPPALSHARLNLTREPFDAIRIEAGALPDGSPAVGALAFSHQIEASAQLVFGGPSGAASSVLDGQRLALGDFRQAMRFNAGGAEIATMAALGGGSQRLQAGRVEFSVATPADGPALQITNSQDCLPTSTIFTPGLNDVRLPIGDEIVQTSRVTEASRIAIDLDVDSASGDGDVVLSPGAAVQIKKLATVLLRPLDFLYLQFGFIGFEYHEEHGQPFLLAQSEADPYLSVTFPPQHIAERSILPSEAGHVGDIVRPFDTLLTGGSRLVFKVPAHYRTKRFPLTIARLLDWSDFQLSVSERALPDMTGKHGEGRRLVDVPLLPAYWQHPEIPNHPPPMKAMEPTETQIEIPLGLYLSPHHWAQWHHAVAPASGLTELAPGGTEVAWIELWHTRLGYFNADGIDEDGRVVSRQELSVHPDTDPKHAFRDPRTDLRTVRAVFADGYGGAQNCGCDSGPFPLLPAPQDRIDIVDFSSNYGLDWNLSENGVENNPCKSTTYLPDAIPYTHFMMSALGANLRLKGEWNPTRIQDPGCIKRPSAIDRWIQDTVWARDQFVLISKKGYGLPTGHYISFVQIRRREFIKVGKRNGKTVTIAALRTRFFCEVREPKISFNLPDDGPAIDPPPAGRRWHIQSATLSPKRTPFLKEPVDWLTGEVNTVNPSAFWMIPEKDNESEGLAGAEPSCAGGSATYNAEQFREDPFEFTLTLTDVQGNETTCKLAIPWVHRYYAEQGNTAAGTIDCNCMHYDEPARPSNTDDMMKKLLAIYLTGKLNPSDYRNDLRVAVSKVDWSKRRFGHLGAQKLAYAPKGNGPQQVKDTAFETSQVHFAVDALTGVLPSGTEALAATMPNIWALNFYPAIGQADIRLGAVSTLAGGDGNAWATVVFNETYRRGGFFAGGNQNKGEVFLDVDPQRATQLNFPGGNSGGLATPSFLVAQLSRILGPVGPSKPVAAAGATARPQTALEGKFDVGQFFDKMFEAKMLGVFGFDEVVKDVEDFTVALDKAIQLVEEKYREVKTTLDQVEALKTQLQRIADFVEKFPNYITNLQDELKKELTEDFNVYAADMMRAMRQDVQDAAGNIILSVEHAVEAKVNEIINTVVQDLIDQAAKYWFTYVPDDEVLRAHSRNIQRLKEILDFSHIQSALKRGYADLESRVAVLKDFPLQGLRGVEARLKGLPKLFDPANPGASLDRIKAAIDAITGELGAIANAGAATFRVDEAKAFLKAAKDIGGALQKKLLQADTLVGSIRDELNDYLAKWTKNPFTLTMTTALPAGHLSDYAGKFKSWLQDLIKDFDAKVTKEIQNVLNKPTQAVIAVEDKVNALIDTAAHAYDQVIDDILDAVFKAIGPTLSTITEVSALIDQVLSQVPSEIKVHFTWKPELQDHPPFIANFNREDATFEIAVEIHKSVLNNPSSPPTFKIVGDLRNFQVELLPSAQFFIVGFERVTFTSVDGAKPNVDVKIGDVRLGEELAFVQELAQIFSPGSGFYLDITPFSAEAGYRYAFPALVAGGFNIFQLALEAGVKLSFNGDPVRAWFALSSREKPASLTAGIYGGACFFSIEVNPKKVTRLEASFEFGAIAYMSVGVASGIVFATGGVYFKTADDVAQLSGFFHAGGAFDIAGLLTLSLEFYLGFTYHREGSQSQAVGECELTVDIDMGLFDISYTLHQRKVLSGGGGGASNDNRNNEQTTSADAENLLAHTQRAATALPSPPTSPPPLEEEWKSYRNKFAL